MNKKYAMSSLKTVILVCLLLLSVPFFGGCKDEGTSVVNSDKVVHLRHGNEAEVKTNSATYQGKNCRSSITTASKKSSITKTFSL